MKSILEYLKGTSFYCIVFWLESSVLSDARIRLWVQNNERFYLLKSTMSTSLELSNVTCSASWKQTAKPNNEREKKKKKRKKEAEHNEKKNHVVRTLNPEAHENLSKETKKRVPSRATSSVFVKVPRGHPFPPLSEN